MSRCYCGVVQRIHCFHVSEREMLCMLLEPARSISSSTAVTSSTSIPRQLLIIVLLEVLQYDIHKITTGTTVYEYRVVVQHRAQPRLQCRGGKSREVTNTHTCA